MVAPVGALVKIFPIHGGSIPLRRAHFAANSSPRQSVSWCPSEVHTVLSDVNAFPSRLPAGNAPAQADGSDCRRAAAKLVDHPLIRLRRLSQSRLTSRVANPPPESRSASREARRENQGLTGDGLDFLTYESGKRGLVMQIGWTVPAHPGISQMSSTAPRPHYWC